MPGKYAVIAEGMCTKVVTTEYEGDDCVQAARTYARIVRKITRGSSDTVSFYAEGVLLEQCQPTQR